MAQTTKEAKVPDPNSTFPIAPPPENIPVNPDAVVRNLLNQLTQVHLIAAKWQALAEEMMQACNEQQGIINELKKKPVHNGRVTRTAKVPARVKGAAKNAT